MKIIIVCSKCGKDLETEVPFIDTLGGIVIKVKPCDDLDCHNCSKCEVEEDNKEMRVQLKKIKETVQTIKE